MPVSASFGRVHRRPIAIVIMAGLLLLTTMAISGRRSSSSCSPEVSVSVSRTWNEALLDAIRRDFPAPTVHARNLYHLSAAAWDIWAAYDPDATGIYVNQQRSINNAAAERDEAISFAAHHILSARYADASGAEDSLAQFDLTMQDLCLDPDSEPEAESPAAFGLFVADSILLATRDDGSLEDSSYLDLSYSAINQPLEVSNSGTEMVDPNRWQPLNLSEQVTQNGQRIEAEVQTYIGSNWGFVTPFALEPSPIKGLPVDPGPPPLLGSEDDAFAAAASEIVGFSSALDTESSATIDISPTGLGNVALGTYNAAGRDLNPETGARYAPNVVLEADYGRVIAEFWADGPHSETPPGHWNTLANTVSDKLAMAGELRIDGIPVDRSEWDVKLALALNGALHDSAIAAWGAKAHYDYSRPISMIRYLGQRGELVETLGVIETITEESTRVSQRHEHLRDHVGEQAVFSWQGQPAKPDALGGVSWIRAADWLPYQRASFVTPAFAAYVSGHSTFSRAAAEVLIGFTGSEFFPGGLMTYTVAPGDLIHEVGPTEVVELQWATYRDAADQAGISRLYGGIHVRADDLAGRKMGVAIGTQAILRARALFKSS
ncbi:MAG: vanadium-dependent haloperoxidase [Acidimicrobiales bacterium]|jgi:hypothetical protein